MNEHDIRRGRDQYNGLRTDTVRDLVQLLRSVRDGADSLLNRLTKYDRLDGYDTDALGELVAAAVQAGRKAERLDTLDLVDHLVPAEDDAEDAR